MYLAVIIPCSALLVGDALWNAALLRLLFTDNYLARRVTGEPVGFQSEVRIVALMIRLVHVPTTLFLFAMIFRSSSLLSPCLSTCAAIHSVQTRLIVAINLAKHPNTGSFFSSLNPYHILFNLFILCIVFLLYPVFFIRKLQCKIPSHSLLLLPCSFFLHQKQTPALHFRNPVAIVAQTHLHVSNLWDCCHTLIFLVKMTMKYLHHARSSHATQFW